MFLGYGAALYVSVLIADLFFGRGGNLSLVLIFGSLGLGLASQLFFDWHNVRPIFEVFRTGNIAIAIMMLGWWLFASETAICIIVAWPVLFVGLGIGLYATCAILNAIDQKTTFCLPLLILPFMAPIFDLGALVPMKSYAVSSQIEMRGTPDEIRMLTQSVPLIADAERPWTFTHSILRAPRPLRAELVDGIRYATWESGVAFEEILTPSDDPQNLSWTFNFPDPKLLKPLDYRVSPLGPEVVLDHGGYQFEAIGPDRTLVTLTTQYRLHTVMNGYFALWGQVFLNDFHMAVLHVIAQRAEATL